MKNRMFSRNSRVSSFPDSSPASMLRISQKSSGRNTRWGYGVRLNKVIHNMNPTYIRNRTNWILFRLFKTRSNNFNDTVLLFRGHFVVRRQTHATGEDIGAHVFGLAGNVGVRLCPAGAVHGDELVHPVHRLHVHRFPDRTTLRVQAGDGLQDFRRAAFARLPDVKGIRLTPHLLAHGILVDNQRAEPVIWNGLLIEWNHFHRKVLQTLRVAVVNGFFPGNVLLQMRVLAANDAGNDIAHAVVVSHLFVLVPRRCFPGLGGPFAGFIGILQGIGQQASAGRTGDDFISVIGNRRIVPKTSALPAFIGSAHGLRCVLNQQCPVLLADFLNLPNSARESVKLRAHHQFDFRIHLKGLLQSCRVHVPGFRIRVDKNRNSSFIQYRVQGGVEGHIGTEHPLAFHGAVAHCRTAVQLLPSQFHAQVQRCRAGREGDRVFYAGLLRGNPFHLVNIRAHGTHPIGIVGFLHIFHFFAVHGRRSQPYLLLKRLHIGSSKHRFFSLSIPIRVVFLPVPGIPAHICQVFLRLPAQDSLRFGSVRPTLRKIPRTSRAELVWYF